MATLLYKELQKAFENLQRSQEPNPKGTIDHNGNDELDFAIVDEYLSDGAGTKDKSNIGVQFKSAPNSDGENDGVLGRERTQKTKKSVGAMRRSTRAIKAKKGLDCYQY